MTFVAQNFGANQKERMLKGTRVCNSILSTWSIFCVIIAYFFARPLIHLLAGTNNPVILKNGADYVFINATMFIFLGYVLNLRAFFQGIGRKGVPIASSAIELIIKIFAAFFIMPRLGFIAIAFCEPVIWFILYIHLLLYWRKFKIT